MTSRRIDRTVKIISVFVAVLFVCSFSEVDSYGQVDMGGVDATSSEVATVETVETQTALPKPGNITVNFKSVDILTVLNYLSEVSGVDIIPSPGVKGTVTMRLRDKPWEVALDIVTRNYGYAYSREGDIIRVMPRSMLQTEELVTEVIPLKHIVREIELVKEGTTIAEQQIEARKQEEDITKIMVSIRSILDPKRGENATFIPSANSIVITAIPAKISNIKAMLGQLDKKPAQILLDAKVIEIVLDDDEDLGIDWDVIITASGARRPITAPFTSEGILDFLSGMQRRYYPSRVTGGGDFISDFPNAYQGANGIDTTDAPTNESIFSFGTLDFSQFQAVLRMISERTDTNILSTPRITTLNNQKAAIKVVQKWMFQKTAEALQTSNVITVEFESEAEAREVGVKLTVIPHVNEKGDIVVNLIPEVSSDPDFREVAITGSAQNAVAMIYNTREANTQIRVKDGETIFIGGLVSDRVSNTVDKIPILGDLLGDIPYVGKAFKYESENVDKTEIVFFVTVHLVGDGMESIRKSHTQPEYLEYCVDYYKMEQARKAEDERLQKMQAEDEKNEARATVKNNNTVIKPTREPGAFRRLEEAQSGEDKKPWFDFRQQE